MKRYLFPLALSLAFLILLTGGREVAFSEDLTFSRAYQDYLYNLDLYNKAHSDYELARASYLQLGTLELKDKAQKATLLMLQDRDEVVKTYLTTLRARLAVAEGVSSDKKNELFSLLDSEVSWFINHKGDLASAASLDDLVSDSDQAKGHYLGTELLIYKTLTTISVGKTKALGDREEDVVSLVKKKISEIKSNGDKDVTTAERGTQDVEGKIARSRTKNDEALTVIAGLKEESVNKAGVFENALDSVSASLQYLKEGGSFLAQIIRDIKTQD